MQTAGCKAQMPEIIPFALIFLIIGAALILTNVIFGIARWKVATFTAFVVSALALLILTALYGPPLRY